MTKQAMAKVAWKPGTMLAPVPAVLVSCGGTGQWRPNLITIAWAGTVCSEPPMLSIAVRPERWSHPILTETGEFVVNVPGLAQARAVDWCGVVSGRDTDKFAGAELTPGAAQVVGCPIVQECPVNIECRTRQTLALGTHTLFLAEIVAVQVSAELLDESGRLMLERAELLAFAHGDYYALGKYVGHFGWSVAKRQTERDRQRRGGEE